VNGNHEDSSEPRAARDIDSISNHVRIRMRDYGMVTIYRNEMERTNIFCRHNRRGTSTKDRSRLLRPIHGMHEMLTAHVSRVYDNRGALLMLFLAGQCLFVTALVIGITVTIALSD